MTDYTSNFPENVNPAYLLNVQDYSIVCLKDGTNRIGYKSVEDRQHFVTLDDGTRLLRNYDELIEVVMSPKQCAMYYLMKLADLERICKPEEQK